jgi:DNA-binding transcriptional LysR family regulator
MIIEQLEYIVEVAKTNSVSIASKNLHISQSGISQSIAKLEKELGIKIFKRSRSGTFPTDEGKKIIEKACEIVFKLHEFQEITKMYKTMVAGKLKISVIPNMMMLLFRVLSDFRNEHPNVFIEIEEKGSSEILEDVKQHKSDVGLITFYDKQIKANEYLVFEKLVKGKIKVFAGKNSPLAFSNSLTPEQLRKHPLVLLKNEDVMHFVKNFSNQYGPLNIWFTTDSNDVIKGALVEGLGIGIGSDHMIRFDPYVLNGEIITFDIDNYTQPNELYFGWIRSKDKALSPAANMFLYHLKSQLGKKSASIS